MKGVDEKNILVVKVVGLNESSDVEKSEKEKNWDELKLCSWRTGIIVIL